MNYYSMPHGASSAQRQASSSSGAGDHRNPAVRGSDVRAPQSAVFSTGLRHSPAEATPGHGMIDPPSGNLLRFSEANGAAPSPDATPMDEDDDF